MDFEKQRIQPLGWRRPSGYSHGLSARGRLLFIAGQVGQNMRAAKPKLAKTFAAQFVQALGNVLDVVREAGGRPEDLVQLTIFITSTLEYQKARKALADAWKLKMGHHYPAMSVVKVSGLMESQAKVEMQGIAVLGEPTPALPLPSTGKPQRK